MNASAGFPPLLGDVPKEWRLPERFGFVPSAFALGALVLAAANAIALIFLGTIDLGILGTIAGAVAIAAIAGGAEVWRRTRPTVLVLKHPHIGVYREGKLVAAVLPRDIVRYKLHPVNTAREVIASGVIFLGGCGGTMATFTTDPVELPPFAWALGAFAVGGAWIASAVWIRIMCVFYLVPKGNKREQVVLLKSDLKRVGWSYG